MRLILWSWRQEPPCSLPDDAAIIANVAKITPQQWASATKCASLLTPGADGRLHFAHARKVYDSMAASSQALSDAKRRAAQARWGPGRTESNADARASIPMHVHETDARALQMHRPDARASAAPSGEARARAERTALLRSNTPDESMRPLSAQSADVIAKVGSARARELLTENITKWREAQSMDMLRKFIADLRAQGNTIPIAKADELSRGRYSSPDRVEAAIARVQDLMQTGRCRAPVGYLISVLGLSQHGDSSLIEVPLQLAAKWDRAEGDVTKRLAVAAATAATLQERREAAARGGQPRTATGS